MNQKDATLLFITRKWPPAVGGMETYSVRLVERLRELRKLDLIALPGRPGSEGPTGMAIVAFGISTFLRLLFSRPSQTVHVADMASWPLAWAVRLRARRTVIVLSAHGTDLSYPWRSGWKAALYRSYMKLGAALLGPAHIIANSRWIADLAKKLGFRSVSVIRMGTDFAPPEPPVATNGALLFAGRIAVGKGLSFLVRDVIPLLENPPVLRVAGAVWNDDEAACLQLPGVEWLGVLPPEQLASEYAAALAVLMPSRLPEGFGLVAAEAAASGGIVIASDHSGLAEAVLPETGFLHPSGDAKAWARQIAQVLAWSAEERASFVARSTAAARSAYSWDRAAEKTEALYRELAAGTRSSI